MMIDVTAAPDIPIVRAPGRQPMEDDDLLWHLDSWTHTGLTLEEWDRLVAMLVCCRCGLTMTRGKFNEHQCLKRMRGDDTRKAFTVPIEFDGHRGVRIPIIEAPDRQPPLNTEIILRLDKWIQPGITDDEWRQFLENMVRCKCSLTMTRRKFEVHQCLDGGEGGSVTIIDLTED